MPRRSTGETPFSMTYGAEAIIPIEVDLSSMRVVDFTRSSNDECMVEGLDALEKKREMVAVRLADDQQKLAQGYNKKVRPQGFVAGDLILWKALGSMKDQNASKLVPNWEGPYGVTATARAKAFYLEDMEERPLPRLWNVCNPKKYY